MVLQIRWNQLNQVNKHWITMYTVRTFCLNTHVLIPTRLNWCAGISSAILSNMHQPNTFSYIWRTTFVGQTFLHTYRTALYCCLSHIFYRGQWLNITTTWKLPEKWMLLLAALLNMSIHFWATRARGQWQDCIFFLLCQGVVTEASWSELLDWFGLKESLRICS